MIAPDFDHYSLALIHQDRIVFSSTKPGLEPILDCLAACRGHYRDCTLHDRVFGLAAARLMAPAGLIGTLVTRAISRPALACLKAQGIEVQAEAIVESILTRDRSRVCPGEVIALETADPDLFAQQIREMMEN